MKKTIAVAAALMMALSMTACASKAQDSAPESAQESVQEGTKTETTEATVTLSTWTEASTAQEAADGAGVGYFEVPADDTQSSIGPINWYGYQYTDLLAQADGAVGAAELTVCKGVNAERQDPEHAVSYDPNDVSGDYTDYAYSWDMDVDDWKVTCFGNEEGKTMKAIWQSDNFSYSIKVRGQGDVYDTFGLGEEDTALIVRAVQ